MTLLAQTSHSEMTIQTVALSYL